MNAKKATALGLIVPLIGMATLFGGCSKGGTSSENGGSNGGSKVVNVICWTEYLPDSVMDDFQKETGIKVNLTTYSSDDEELAKLEAGKDGTYDLLVGGNTTVLKTGGKLEKLDFSKLSNYGNIDKEYRTFTEDPKGEYTVPYMGVTAVIAVNSDKVKEPVTSYQDLLKSEFKDSEVVIEDAQAVVGMADMATGHSFNDLSDKALSDAKAYLEKLRPNIHAFNGDSPKTLLLNGECSVGLIYNGEAAMAQSQNPAIKVYYPKEGVYYAFDHLSITAAGQNKENAYKFLNYILDAKVSKSISDQYQYINPNEKAVELLGSSYQKNPLFVLPADVVKLCQTPNGRTSADKTKVANLWAQIKG